MCGGDDLPHPAKRRRIAHAIQGREDGMLSPLGIMSGKTSREITPAAAEPKDEDRPRCGTGSVTPFLTKHLPQQYTTKWSKEKGELTSAATPGSKYCYRHQPGRRQANEPSMDQLQEVCSTMVR